MRVFAISLILFSVSCSAATIVGEFSGVVGSFDLLSAGFQNYYSQAGLSEGDLITGSFSYESDAPLSEIERQNPLRGATYYEANYLRLQFGDLALDLSAINTWLSRSNEFLFDLVGHVNG